MLNGSAAGQATLGNQLLSSWSSDSDFRAVIWLVSACNGLIDCCMSVIGLNLLTLWYPLTFLLGIFHAISATRYLLAFVHSVFSLPPSHLL